MSNTFREYLPGIPAFSDACSMTVTATTQGKHGAACQFTIGLNYIVLSEAQVKDLVIALEKRLNCAKGYSATDTHGEAIDVNGNIINEGEL